MTLIVIVYYGTDMDPLRNCVASFLDNESDIQILVVNNNPYKIRNEEVVKDKRLQVINFKKNVGWGGAVNKILQLEFLKKAEFVLLTNDDTFIEKPIIASLKKELEKGNAGIVGPVVKFYKNGKNVFDLGGFINKRTGMPYHKETHTLSNKFSSEVDFLGVCLLIKKDLLKLLNGFDEDFFLYYEDVDFCLRAKNLEYSTMVVPQTIITHELSKTIGKESKKALFHQTRSALVYMNKDLKTFKLVFFLRLFGQSIIRTIKKPSSGIYAFKAMLTYQKKETKTHIYVL